jgi:tetratricopeptide (TPR) repeat protein
MKHLAYIDDYFKGTDTASHNRQFEQRLLDDPSFAEEVAFYLTTQRLLQEEARMEKIERFRKLYQQGPAPLRVVRSPYRIWRYVAAAAVIVGILFTINLLTPPSKQQMADSYIRQELNDLDVSMSGMVDSVELMRTLYNKGKFADALTVSEAIISHDAGNQKALEYAGVTNLRLQQYDKALAWFKQLAASKAYSNKGHFYQALTLIKRNQAGDLALAKTLLEQVVKEDLEGREIAKQWLEKW